MKYLFWGIIGVWFVIGLVDMSMKFGWIGGVIAVVIAPATVLLAMLQYWFLGLMSIIVLTVIGREVK